MKAEDAQFLESKPFSIEEIRRVFNEREWVKLKLATFIANWKKK